MAASTNIKLNIVEPGTPPSPTPTPTPVDPGAGVGPTAPSTGLFTHGIGGPEATIISAIILLAVAAIVVAVLYNKHKKQGKVTKLVHAVDQCKAIFSSRKRITASLSALALLASVGTLAILLANSNKTNTNAMEGGTELTVDVNSEDLTIEVGDSPVFAYLPVELTVEEATTSGYVLSAYAEDTNLVSTTDESNIIPMVAADEGELVALAENTYGLSLAKPETKDDNIYTALSMDQDSPTILKSIDDYSETEENDTTTIYYGFYITPDTPKGTYEGSNITYTALTNPPVATVTFDGNGLYFNNDESQVTNIVKYEKNATEITEIYSHTSNLNDIGEVIDNNGYNRMYPTDTDETFAYEFADATNVNVKIVKTGSDGYSCGYNNSLDDYFSLWAGYYPNYTAKSDYESGIKAHGNTDGKYVFGAYAANNSIDFDIEGNTVTFSYTTGPNDGMRGCSSGYGYYAIITAKDADGNNASLVGNNPVIGNYAVPSTETTHRFLGWSTDKNALTGTYTSASDFTFDSSLTPGDNITVYAIWDPIIEITYNGNGADDTTDMANVNQYTTDFTTAGRTVDLLASNYQRAGYGFIGWSEDKDAYTKLVNGEDVTIYGPNETMTIGREMQQRMSQTGGLELNAIWAEVAKDSQGNDLTFQTDDLLTTELADGTTLATKPNGYVTALKDSRDNEVYAVAKLADGNYWMIENLRLDNSSELSQQNTNYPALPLTNDYNAGTTSNFLSATSNSWCTSSNAQCNNQSKLNTNNVAATTTSPEFSQNYTNGTHASDFNTNLYSYGNYYNWYSATAGRGAYETSSNQVTAGDICPAGWQLPYGGSGDINNGKGNTSGGFYYLNNLLGNSSNAWRSFPNNFIYSGYWYNSQTSSRGNNGYYWSSTANNNNYTYYLYLYNSGVSPTSNTNKYYGSSVRCIAPIQTTITFDGNGSTSGEMAKQRIAQNTTAPLDSNKFTKGGDIFVSWNTERDGSGASYTDGQEYTAGEGINKVILYAQWREPAAISDLTYMQDFATLSEGDKVGVLNSMTAGDQYQLKDNRDQKDYYISKLADGNIWMTQNLDLDIVAGKTYTSTDTDLANSAIGTSWTPTASTSTTSGWTTSNTAPGSYNPGNLYWNGNVTTSSGTLSDRTTTDPSATSGGTHYHVGNYYNWTAATAMNDSSSYTSYTSQYTDVNQSICPAGWRLPTYSGDKSYLSLKNAQGLTAGTSGNIQNSPTYFVYGGNWGGSSTNVGYLVLYWSSVVGNNNGAYQLYFDAGGGLSPQVNAYRGNGSLLRCVAR